MGGNENLSSVPEAVAVETEETGGEERVRDTEALPVETEETGGGEGVQDTEALPVETEETGGGEGVQDTEALLVEPVVVVPADDVFSRLSEFFLFPLQVNGVGTAGEAATGEIEAGGVETEGSEAREAAADLAEAGEAENDEAMTGETGAEGAEMGEGDVTEEETVDAVVSYEDSVVASLSSIRENLAEHPFLTTPFSEYSVTEGLLLFAFLLSLFKMFFGWLREGFSWLS